MTHPVNIWVDSWSWYRAPKDSVPKYIRADLVDELKRFAFHDGRCPKNRSDNRPCTCGLSETLRKLEE